MSKLRDFIRKITPKPLLQLFRFWKKKRKRAELKQQKQRGEVLTADILYQTLQKIGIQKGDSVLVHASMSKIGYLENGPATVVDALLKAVGSEGHILMPSSPNPELQLDYVRNNTHYDVRNSPSKMGGITEYFRKLPAVKRSLSPTEPVCALGPKAEWITEGHRGKMTPYDADSPFSRLTELNGKILYIGVSLINAGTSLHLLEDAVEDFPLPVYHPDLFSMTVIDENGLEYEQKIRVHNPEVSAKRRCDELLPWFTQQGVCEKVKIGQAETWLFDAKKMLETMLEGYKNKGITMYTPHGNE